MKLHDLHPAPGSTKAPRRVGRGIAGKGGKTAGRGTKGAGARDNPKPGFEGGQLPLTQRIPKLKGFKNPFRVEYAVINLDALERLRGGHRHTRNAPRRGPRPQEGPGEGAGPGRAHPQAQRLCPRLLRLGRVRDRGCWWFYARAAPALRAREAAREGQRAHQPVTGGELARLLGLVQTCKHDKPGMRSS